MLEKLKPRSDGQRVLLWLVGFFGVVMAVNAVFVYFALNSWSGLTVENPYERGVAYNKVIEQSAAEASLGWQIEAAWGAGIASVTVRDRHGQPMDDLKVVARFMRPTHEGHDREFALEWRGQGRYSIAADLPLPGQWEMAVRADRAGTSASMIRRITAP